jgi:hypothetical protein
VWIDIKAAIENRAAIGFPIQVPAGFLGVDDLPSTILQFFMAASSTLPAEGIPQFFINCCINHGKNYFSEQNMAVSAAGTGNLYAVSVTQDSLKS